VIRVLIVDNHVLVREGFKKIITAEQDLTVAGECKNASEVLEFFRHQLCDVVVLDIDMPGKSGLDLLLDLKKLVPNVKVLIQSIMPESQFAIRALKMGAVGYITKDAAADELVKAIRRVFSGRRYLSSDVSDLLLNMNNEGSILHERLSDREFRVLQLIGSGKSVSEIAEILFLSVHTVNTYRKRIMEKMEMHSTAELIHYAVKNSLTG
jgi:DNA-binding NarL/FixJ family response regulator